MTTDRRETIRQIISERSVEKQSQLLEALNERGIRCTQATLSRDIKDRVQRALPVCAPRRLLRPHAAEDADYSA